ncbi:MAG: tRNA uridine(34) 5-carboxymethylaminomethyl modification radical SAM/GNAT enzyme Elp3 [Candidatus Methanomethylicia archaeon]
MIGKVYGNAMRSVKKPVRSVSGVTVVAVMTKPYPCPHGRCIYCPGGVYWSEATPQSYVPESPVVMRAKPLNYDPFEQVKARLINYRDMGHEPSKVELIVMGGTFPAMPQSYQEWFIARCFEALNGYPFFKEVNEETSIKEAHRKNEYAKARCIGLTIETRPDWAKEPQVDFMLYLGATRCEIGVQAIDDDILAKVKRGHRVEDVIEATRILKDSGFKVCYHIMPGLPNSDLDKDFEMFKTIFEDSKFKPDQLKIYPTLVIPGTELYEMWRKGEYEAYTIDETIKLIAEMKRIVPKYVRIVRVGRDIPLQWVAAGPKTGNLRQLVLDYMEKRKWKCKCIRCREVGHYILKTMETPKQKKLKLSRIDYEASEGYEVFLSYEDENDTLYSILRLRIPSGKAHRWEFKIGRCSIVRELHVYGYQVPVGVKYEGELWWQHKSLGRGMLIEAERIALEEFNCHHMYIISGIGVREYYRSLGYTVLGNSPYMYKHLTSSNT